MTQQDLTGLKLHELVALRKQTQDPAERERIADAIDARIEWLGGHHSDKHPR